jgi:hypothetical protein
MRLRTHRLSNPLSARYYAVAARLFPDTEPQMDAQTRHFAEITMSWDKNVAIAQALLEGRPLDVKRETRLG